MAICRLSQKKHDFFANDFKHMRIIYHWKSFFATINNLRLLLENMALFGLDQLLKFSQFSRKSVSSIRAFLSRMEGTNTVRRLRANNWNLEMAVGVAGEGVLQSFSPWPSTRGRSLPWVTHR